MTGKHPIPTDEAAVQASMVEVVGADGAVKTDFTVLPYGNPFYGRDGRGPWILRDKVHAEIVIAATGQMLGGCDLMADYDHQSHYAKEGVGIQAPAAGWTKRLYAGEDGIHAVVDWTPGAEAALAAREWRYISPDFRVSKTTREVTRLVAISLTNQPNLELPALAHQALDAVAGEDDNMTMISVSAVALAAALALPVAGLNEAGVLAAIETLKTGSGETETALAAILTELKLAADADTETVLAAVRANSAAPDPAQFVPKIGFDQVNNRLRKLEEDRVLAMVDAAVAGGKVPPAMRDWALELGKKDEAQLCAYLDKAVPFQGNAQLGGKPEPEPGKLSAEEKAICAMTGVSEADFLKTRDEEKA